MKITAEINDYSNPAKTPRYLEGAKLNIVDCVGKEHTFVIKMDGFYVVDETGAKPKVFLAHGIKYWTILPLPKIKPDDILTIE